MADGVRLGFLYPFHGAEDDYPRMAAMVTPSTRAEVVHTSISEDAHRVDALLETGSIDRLLEGVAELANRDISAAMWACTSGSFVLGLQGARAQVVPLQEALGVPVSSTSLAFLDASAALGLQRVSIGATYPQDIAELFAALLEAGGLEVVGMRSLGILAGLDVGSTLGLDDVLELVRQADDPAADAILLPDTALHTAAWMEDLEAVAGKPVLTANQVTMWKALQLAGVRHGRAPALGRLFSPAGD